MRKIMFSIAVALTFILQGCSSKWCVDVKYVDYTGKLTKDTTICTKEKYIMLGEGDVVYDESGTIVIIQ
jgi:hypothetical protein